MNQVQQNIHSARKSALCQMWTIVGFVTFSALYDFIYSIVIAVVTDPQCHPSNGDVVKGDYWKLSDRLFAFYIWQIPVFYILWPTTRNTNR